MEVVVIHSSHEEFVEFVIIILLHTCTCASTLYTIEPHEIYSIYNLAYIQSHTNTVIICCHCTCMHVDIPIPAFHSSFMKLVYTVAQ